MRCELGSGFTSILLIVNNKWGCITSRGLRYISLNNSDLPVLAFRVTMMSRTQCVSKRCYSEIWLLRRLNQGTDVTNVIPLFTEIIHLSNTTDKIVVKLSRALKASRNY